MAVIKERELSPLEKLAQQLGVLPRDRDWVSADQYHEELLDLVYDALQTQKKSQTTIAASTPEEDRNGI